MVYDITVGFSNGLVRTFKGITKIESMDYMYGNLIWNEIENPLKFNFNIFGDYRFSNKSTSAIVHTLEAGFSSNSPYSMGIIFVEVKRTENQQPKKENVK